jgi:hypothetical protein
VSGVDNILDNDAAICNRNLLVYGDETGWIV